MRRQKRRVVKIFLLIFFHSLKNAYQDKAHWFATVLYSLILLVTFSFTLPIEEQRDAMYVLSAQIVLIVVITLHHVFEQLFDSEDEDGGFILMQTYPISSSGWFFAKYFQAISMAFLIIIPEILLIYFLYQNYLNGQQLIGIVGVVFLSLIAQASVGVFLAALTRKLRGRQILYPVLFYPMITPVVLALSESLKNILKNQQNISIDTSWLYLLFGFGWIYGLISWASFDEILGE